jgi:protein-L-isoaspartate(D-aspartate) O-methyltransferase
MIEAATFVLSLRARGIADLRLLRAMETVRREVFAPRRYGDLARQDVALPLPCGETMTAPTTVALMLAALGLQPGMRVLEVGTGSGYVTALLVVLGGHVHSVERKSVLLDSARQRLRAAGHVESCEMACRDGLSAEGGEARYDRILLNGAFLDGAVPAAVTSRLAVGGRLVAGAAERPGSTRLLVLERQPDGELASRSGAAIRLSRFS